MIITILQLSDWHIKNESVVDDEKIERMCNFVISNTGSSEAIFVICTGDLAYSGRKKEFDKFEQNLEVIKKRLNDKKMYIVLSAGNHDCEYPERDSIRPLIINEILDKKIYDEDMVESLTKPLFNYYQSEDKYQENCSYQSKLGSKYNFKFGEFEISIVTIHSSWMSLKSTTPGYTFFPSAESQLLEKNPGVSFLAMHHTPNWYHSEQQREIRTHLLNFSFVLTGHEHEGDNYSLQKEMYRSDMIEGDEFSPFKGSKKSGFNILNVDLAENKYSFVNARSNDDNFYTPFSTVQWTSIQDRSASAIGDYELNPSFLEYLLDAGAPFNHPIVANLGLEDLFIYPDLRKIAKDLSFESKGLDDIVNLRTVIIDNEKPTVCIVGGERSGKTSICKKLFREKLSSKFIPVMLYGEKIKSRREEDFTAMISSAIQQEYHDLDYDVFVNISADKKVVIIDNFHLSDMKYTEKAQLLQYLLKVYKNIYITIDEYMEFDGVFSVENVERENQKDFSRYYLMPFGYQRRNELIKKWYSIGNSVYDNEFYRKIDYAESMFDTIVCKNFVPAYPFYLFTAISAFDGVSTEGLTESSYATYYSLLMLGTLKQIDRRPQEIELMLSYLSALAFKIYEMKNSSIEKKDLEYFHLEYCSKHQIKLETNPLLEKFIQAKLVAFNEDVYYFKYKYFYYYFLAKYLADNISNSFARDVIIDLCINLHMDTSSNVVMFLTHLSKDPFIIDCIVQQADSLFSDNRPIRLDDDVSFVDSLIGNAPKLIIKDESASNFREQQLKRLDKINGDYDDPKIVSGKEIELNESMGTDFEGPDKILLLLGATYKTLDIIGIILKNHYGSLTGDVKLSLCEQAYTLPLRALAEYFKFLGEHKTAILEEIAEILRTKHHKVNTSVDKDSISRRIVFELTEAISFSFIKKTASSLGSDKLALTFESVLSKNDFQAAKLIDMAIKIDCHKDFPVEEVKRVLSSFKKNHIIAHCVLRDLALYKMYMYELPHDKRQKICSLFNISMANQTRQNVFALEKGIKMNKS